MIERTSEPVTTPWDDDDDPNQDTIALLQEEIARLESELRARDEADSLPPPPAGAGPELDDPDGGRRRVDGLLAEAAVRDETIELLLEQCRLFEEAAATQRAEWEQLHTWVEEVERRVDRVDTEGPRLASELQAERERGESLKKSAERDRRDWEAHRAGLDREVQHLRDQLARVSQRPDARDDSAFIELAAENRRLRAEIEASEASDSESKDLGRRLVAVMVELEQARRDLRHLGDERDRERNERDAEIATLRSRLARESLLRASDASDPKPPAAVAARGPTATDADERIRAFRQHLKEVHEHEATDRASKSLTSRLSRLWRHTGPG